MKKYIYSLFAWVAMMLGTASCSNEDELIPSGNEGVEVSFQLAMNDVAASRALTNDPADDVYGRGTKVDNVIAAVFFNGEEIHRKPTNQINSDLTCNVTFRLIEGQTYDFVFWAEKNGTYVTTDLTAIGMNYDNVAANDENRDAFTAVKTGLKIQNGMPTQSIVLTRPFAQLNIASTDEEHSIAEAASFGCDVLQSQVFVQGAYSVYNAYTEKPSDPVNVTFKLAEVPGASGEVLKQVKSKTDTKGTDYKGYLAMNYFLAEKESSQTINVGARFRSSVAGTTDVKIDVPNVPVQRNYRTNIIGNILTEQTVFNIIIDPNFNDPDYVVGWDGKTVTPVTPNGDVYEIESASQLAWIAQEVNKGTNFEGETVKLMQNINLGNAAWTPIGTFEKQFAGIFNGNDREVRSFSVYAEEGAGLFGFVGGEATIKNVTIADATIMGHHYAGSLAGWVQSTDTNHEITIDNCQAKDVTVTLTPDAQKDNGNHAGGLIGYTVRTNVTKCTVDNAQVTAYRDCGGLVGCGNAGSKVTGNTVKNTIVTVDQTVEYKEANKAANAGKVVGRRGSDVTEEKNVAGDDVVVTVKQMLGDTQSIPSGYYILNGKSIEAETGSALTIAAGENVTLEVKGNVTLKGAAGGHGISVPADATLEIVGEGHLTVIGNAGVDDATGGSGIAGSVTIDGLKKLTAEGWGRHGFGIGGNNAAVSISNTTINYVKGGFVQPLNDTEYGKSEPEGGAAIGGEVITLKNVVVTEAHGGSKAAAIGAQYHQNSSISIDGCTITAFGGNASAGIGGSRYASKPKYDLKIMINNSTINATGGQFGAGIGAGYDTYCAANETNAVNDIQIVKSVVTAQGGRYAAGIGTGYHSAALTGSIDAESTINAKAGEDYYKDTYTKAQAIGYGVVDPAREYKDAKVTFTVAGKVIEAPKAVNQN